jgi:phosphatidylglycerophosphate synthase
VTEPVSAPVSTPLSAPIASRVNLPNALSLLRLVGTPALFWLAQLPDTRWAGAWFGILGLTDALDGFLARRWNQTSEFGSRLDGLADLLFYPSGAALLYWLFPAYLQPNLVYIVVTLGLLVAVNGYSWLRFGRIILLHTNLGRWAGVLAFLAVLGAFFTDTSTLIRITAVAYSVSFVEGILIFKLRGPVSPDTRSLFSQGPR